MHVLFLPVLILLGYGTAQQKPWLHKASLFIVSEPLVPATLLASPLGLTSIKNGSCKRRPTRHRAKWPRAISDGPTHLNGQAVNR